MHRAFAATLAALACTAAVATLGTAQPASASGVSYMLKNVATGKCMKGNSNRTAYPDNNRAYDVTMVTCNRNDVNQWWGYISGGTIVMTASTHDTGICLSVQKTPSGDFARGVYTARCANKPYGQKFNTGVTSNYPIGSASPACYVGHYAGGDSWPACYGNHGSNTRWNWVS